MECEGGVPGRSVGVEFEDEVLMLRVRMEGEL